jgi:hypothetical protein
MLFSPEALRLATSHHPSSSESGVASSGSDHKPSPVENLPSTTVGACNNDMLDLLDISCHSPLPMFDFAGICHSSIKSFNTDSDVESGCDTPVSIMRARVIVTFLQYLFWTWPGIVLSVLSHLTLMLMFHLIGMQLYQFLIATVQSLMKRKVIKMVQLHMVLRSI